MGITGLLWLALNVHHEARGEPFICQVMVAEVTMRRVDSPYFPDNIKDVVLEPSQFSWANNKTTYDFSVLTPSDFKAAEHVIKYGYYYTLTELHYARYDVSNYWTETMLPPSMQCGNHVFYDNGGNR